MNTGVTKIESFLYRWAPPFLIMTVIFWWSSQSVLPATGVPVLWWDFIVKKIAHLTEYALLFWSWQRALNWNKEEETRTYFVSFLLVLVFALSDEVHQSLTPGRHPKINDVGYDMLGSFLVYLKLKSFI